jgi:hypothetical protein
MANKQRNYDFFDYEQVNSKAGHKLLIEYVGAKELKKMPTSLNPYPSNVKHVDFFAYLESYSDDFNSTFSTKNVYGRMDPIVNYENTTRTINIAFKIPATDLFQARMNLQKLSKLSSFLYPVYEKNNESDSYFIKQAPILRMTFGNIIMDHQSNGGLYGYLNGGVSYKWDLQAGVFLGDGNTAETIQKPESFKNENWHDWLNESKEKRNRYYPKIVDLSLSFNVLHNHLSGHPSNETQFDYNHNESEFKSVYGFRPHAPMHTGIQETPTPVATPWSEGVSLQSENNDPAGTMSLTVDQLDMLRNKENYPKIYIGIDSDAETGMARSQDVNIYPTLEPQIFKSDKTFKKVISDLKKETKSNIT